MSAFDYANTIASEFNRNNHDVQLKVVVVARPVEHQEVFEFAETRPGWMLPGQLVGALRGRKASHGESVSAGRLLKAMGYPDKKFGPHRLYQLDNTQRSRAD